MKYWQKMVMENKFDLIKPPHSIKSRPVTNQDIDRVIADAQKMFKLCVDGCLSIAHSQIDDKDPLCFFCTADKIFINPEITRHTKAFVDSQEGCKTFPGRELVTIKRHYKIEFDFYVIDQHLLSEKQHTAVKGISAFVVQHEIDHFIPKYVYEK